MLERIREGSQGFWAVVILGLVILSFVFAGVSGYVSTSTSVAAATVNGEEISQDTLERAYQNERARLESQYGDAFAALAADGEYLKQFKNNVLERLIGFKLLEQAARDMGIRPSDQQVRDAIVNMQEFQIGGQFNNDRYQAIVRQAGFQPANFRDYVRTELTRQQVVEAILGSEFVLPGEAQAAYGLQAQTRDIRFLTVPSAPFEADVDISAEEITAYYQDNISRYDTEEQVRVAYVELSVADLTPNIEVSEEELLTYYEQTQDLYQTEEQRRASHILIEFGDDQDSAKAAADALLTELEQGADFAALAAEHSADTFSAENGGDLDFFGRGAMDPAFEEATFALASVGDISPVVESAFGYHIIKLTDIKAQQVTPFEQVRDEIATQVKTDKATEEFFNLQQRMAQVAFEVPDTLAEVAAEVNKTVVETELFTRNTAPALLNTPEALSAAFSDELIEDQVNSDLIELSNDQVLVLRVIKHEAERTKAESEVEGEIRTALIAQKAQQAAKAWAEDTLAMLTAGEAIDERLAAYELEWQAQEAVSRFGSQVAPAVAEKAFQLALQEGQNSAVVELASGDVSLVELSNVHAPEEMGADLLAGLQRQIEDGRSQLLLRDVVEALKANADISIAIN